MRSQLRIQTPTRWTKTFMPETRELTLADAVREAMAEEMRRDPRVFVLGEDIAEAGTVFKVLTGLVDEFGTERVLDTPISEAGFTGIAVGAAMTTELFTVSPDDFVFEAIRLMGDKQVRRIPVVNADGSLAGIIAMADVALEMEDKREIAETLEEISSGASFWGRN